MESSKSSDTFRILKGISFSWIKYFLTIGIGIFQTPLLFKNLPKLELNFWYIFFSFGAFLNLADLGLGSSISRIIAYLDNSNSGDDSDFKSITVYLKYSIKQIYYTALFSFSSILLIVVIAIYYSYMLFHNKAAISSNVINYSFIFFLGGIFFNLLTNIPSAVLMGYRDIGYDSIVKSITQLSYFILILIFLPIYKSIFTVSLAFFFQNFIQFIILHTVLYTRHKLIFKVKLEFKKLLQLNIVKTIYKESFPLVINQLGEWLTLQGSIIIATMVVGYGRISDYAVNQQLFTYGVSIALVVNQSMGPFIAKQFIKSNKESLINYYKSTTTICLIIVCFFIIIFLSNVDNIMFVWIGGKHFLGYAFAVLFALIAFCEVQHSVAGNFVWNMGKWPFNKWTLIAGILNVIFGYILGIRYGLLGIAIATFGSKFITLNWYVVYYCLKKLEITIKEYLLTILVPIIAIVAIVLCFTSFARYFMDSIVINKIVYIIIVSSIGVITFSLLIWLKFKNYFKALYQLRIANN
jgi:O-antigen/teichoic acid export membrane protein